MQKTAYSRHVYRVATWQSSGASVISVAMVGVRRNVKNVAVIQYANMIGVAHNVKNVSRRSISGTLPAAGSTQR